MLGKKSPPKDGTEQLIALEIEVLGTLQAGNAKLVNILRQQSAALSKLADDIEAGTATAGNIESLLRAQSAALDTERSR